MPGDRKRGRPVASVEEVSKVNNNIMTTAFSMWNDGKTLEDVRVAFSDKHAYINYLRNIWVHLQKVEKAEEDEVDRESDWDDHLDRDDAFVELLMACGGHPVIVKTPRGPVWIDYQGRAWVERKPPEEVLRRARKLQVKYDFGE